MENLPTKASAKGNAFTVADFYEAGREALSLTLVAGGENLERRIGEPIVNRPGLALTGFYDLCRAVLVKTEAEYDKFDGLFLEYFKGIPFEEELPEELMDVIGIRGQTGFERGDGEFVDLPPGKRQYLPEKIMPYPSCGVPCADSRTSRT